MHLDRLRTVRPAIPYAVFLLCVFATTYALVFNPKVGLHGDNARFYVYGEAISQGAGYVNIHTAERTPAKTVPPGYPFLIAVSIKMGLSEFAHIKAINGLLFGLTLLLFFGNRSVS